MRVVVPPITHRSTVPKEVLGRPGHHVRLSRGDLLPAVGTAIGFLRAMRGDLSDEPVPSTTGLLLGTAVGQARDIAHLI